MSMESAMVLVNRLLVQAQALAALTAYVRLKASGETVDPALRMHLERVVDLLDARAMLDAMTQQERVVVAAFARSYLHQAVELADDPARANAWTHTDPAILQAQGAASAVVARLIASGGIGRAGIRILDVGTGVAGLAIAFCHAFPGSTVVGLDPWEPALTLAKANVMKAGLAERITLLPQPIQSFADHDGFDLVWLPSFFIPDTLLDDALRHIRAVLRPGADLVVGIMEAPPDPIAAAVDALITVRSGGAVLGPEDASERLARAGFADVREVERSWDAPLRLLAARRDTAGRAGSELATPLAQP